MFNHTGAPAKHGFVGRQKFMAGMTLVKAIVVKGKMVSLVVKP